MAECYKALLANESSCASASIAIIHLANKIKSIHALRKNVNTVAMLMHDALLRHFWNRGVQWRDRRLCTFIYYVLLISLMHYSKWCAFLYYGRC